jgi:hypothetical protein
MTWPDGVVHGAKQYKGRAPRTPRVRLQTRAGAIVHARPAHWAAIALTLTASWIVPVATAHGQLTSVGAAQCAPDAVACSSIASDPFVIAWSRWNARIRRYVPVVFHRMLGVQPPVRTRVRGRRAAFDLDVYAGAVRVYSRCAGDPGGPSQGCAVYRRDGHRERRLGAITSTRPLHPVLGLRLVAVVTGSERTPRLVICSKFGRHCRTGPRLFPARARDVRVTGMDTSGRRLAIATSWRDAEGVRSAIQLIRNVEHPRIETLAAGKGTEQVFSPSLNIGMVFFVRGTPGCKGTATSFVRRSPQSGAVRIAPAPLVSAMTFEARAVWYIRCPVDGTKSAEVFMQQDPFNPPPGPPPPTQNSSRSFHVGLLPDRRVPVVDAVSEPFRREAKQLHRDRPQRFAAHYFLRDERYSGGLAGRSRHRLDEATGGPRPSTDPNAYVRLWFGVDAHRAKILGDPVHEGVLERPRLSACRSAPVRFGALLLGRGRGCFR